MKRTIFLMPLIALQSVVGCNQDDNYNDRNGDKEVIPPAGTTIKMMTYNTYGARADDPGNTTDLDKIAEVILRQDPDFVALQEIDVYTNRSGTTVHQAKDLAEKLKMYWHYTPARDMNPGSYGDAVLSKHKILETHDYKMTAPYDNGELRSVCVIKVKVDGEPLYVMSTHLSHESPENRVAQAKELRDIIGSTNGNIIIGGDFNAKPGSEAMTTVRAYLTPANQGKYEYTYPSDEPNSTIDYILYTPLENFSTESYTVLTRADQRVGGVDASDHLPVVATLKMKIQEREETEQPDNIVVSFAEPGIQPVIDSETDFLWKDIAVNRDVDAEQTIIKFEPIPEDDVIAMLPAGETYVVLTGNQWSIENETVSFEEGSLSKTVKVSFNPPQTVDINTYFVLGLTMTSTTPEVTFDQDGDKIVFRVKAAQWRGSGTQSDPYLIFNLKDMMSMKGQIENADSNTDIYYTLINDIDLAGEDWDPLYAPDDADGPAYRIIHFEGSGRTISNLTCKEKDRASFFGQLIGSCANVTFKDVDILVSSGTSIGGVASVVGHEDRASGNDITKITNTHVTGTLKAPGNVPIGPEHADIGSNRTGCIGGICGTLRHNSVISECSVDATITGTEAGGIAGDCKFGTIERCFYSGDIRGSGGNSESHTGGIVGFATEGTIKNCYSGGTVTSESKTAGGIVGWQHHNFTISCCYSMSRISGHQKTGGIVGTAQSNNGTIEYCIAGNGEISSNTDASSGLISGWIKGTNLTARGCYYQTTIKLIVENVEVDYLLSPGTGLVDDNFSKDWIDGHTGTNRYNGMPGMTKLKDTALIPELGWDASVWDLTGESPKLQWENQNP